MRRLLVAIALIALLPLAASAQIEVGFDAGFTLISPDIEGVDTDNITTFEIPFQQMRVGTFVTPNISIEGLVSFYRESEGDFSSTDAGLIAVAEYHFTEIDAWDTMPFLGAGGGLVYTSFDTGTTDDSDSSFGVGVTGGVKMPKGENFAFRLQGSFLKFFEGDTVFPDFNMFIVSVGLSYFFR